MLSKIKSILNQSYKIAVADSGATIGMQIVNFLITYFALQYKQANNEIILLYLITAVNLLSLSAIIVRIFGLTKKVKYDAVICYSIALRKLPLLLILYFIISFPLTAISAIAMKFGVLHYMGIVITGLLPLCIFTSINIIAYNVPPLRSITFAITEMNSINKIFLVALMSALYCLPLLLELNNQYVQLFTRLWFLVCHIITIVMYSSLIKLETDKKSQTSKIIRV